MTDGNVSTFDGLLTFDEVMRNQMTEYECKENIHTENLDLLIDNLDAVFSSGNILMKDRKYNVMTLEQIRTALTKYRTNRRQGKKIMYKFAKNCSNGRLFSQTLSGQGMTRSIRHTLYRENYVDIDIVNCHPVLLSWFCHQKGYDCSSLDRYINERDSILEELTELWNMTKEDVKNIFLKTINGGKEYRIPCQNDFFSKFENEIQNILQKVKSTATDEELESKTYNVEGSILNHRLCCIENYVLKIMVDFFKSKGFNNLILCFDGFLVLIAGAVFLPELQSHLNKLGIPNLKVIIKPMDDFIDLAPYSNKLDFPLNPLIDFDPDYTIDDFDTDFIGKSFSSINDFKTKIINKYCKVFAHFRDFIDPVYRCKDNKFKTGFPNCNFYKWKVGDKTFNIFDIVSLFPTIVPRYEKWDTYPAGYGVYGEECPNNILNMWSGFKAKRLDSYDISKIERCLAHIKKVWADDNDDINEYLLDYLAHIIQYPWRKTEVLLLLYSLPRSGKNSITKFMRNRVIGPDYAHEGLGVDILIKKFNADLANKVFVCCNELPQLTSSNRNGIFDSLKTAITDDTRQYEIKGGRTWSGPNYINAICTTNHDFTYHIEKYDGRVFPLRCSDYYCGNHEYFDDLHNNHLQQENADHFITFLYQRKIKRDLRKIPETQLKKEMIEMGLPSPCRFVDFIKENPDVIADLAQNIWQSEWNKIIANIDASGYINSSHLHLIYSKWCKSYDENTMSSTACGKIWKSKDQCNLKWIRSNVIKYEKFW